MCLGPPGFFEGKSSDAIGLFRGEWVVYACSDEDSLYSLGVGEAERLRNEIRELQVLLRLLGCICFPETLLSGRDQSPLGQGGRRESQG